MNGGDTFPVPVVPCRSCGARCFWAVTTNGKRLLVDVTAYPDGNVVTVPRPGKPLMLMYNEARHGKTIRRKAHFATCPDAEKWKKDKPKQKEEAR